ncbi:hypothetical protein [Microbispora sp. NPDC049125]|uniref:hypothetical protein n=1 Tax=Microbispora sp. NPDC049125 TaxID=3154929 RepID=UPI003466365B
MSRALTAGLGQGMPLGDLGGEAGADRVAAWFTGRWGGAAAASFNARLDALGPAGETGPGPPSWETNRLHRLLGHDG